MPPTDIPPVVRLFLPCFGISCDTAVRPNRYTLDGLFYALQPPPGLGYPSRAGLIWFFCQLANATGTHEFAIDLSYDLDARVRPLRSFRVAMGDDRLAVRHFAVRVEGLPFRRPGVYEFRLLHGATVLSRYTGQLEDAT